MALRVLTGADVFDGTALLSQRAVVIEGGAPQIIAVADIPDGAQITTLDGGTLMPGFVDLQVNGGGGVMFNARPDEGTLRIIAQAHETLGTHRFLPTLITDTPQTVTAAIEAVEAAIALGLSTIAGLHLEGPHLDPVRKGAHDAGLIRPMLEADMIELLRAADRLPNLMVTLAPHSVRPDQIKTLSQAGIIVSLGHSDTDYDGAMRAFEAGARCTTHLFNAMSQLGSRTPGLVGAALDMPQAFAGLIADGVHVHPATIRSALGAKNGGGEIFLVTDAMACAGSDITAFTLNGREILRADGRLTLADGTLAGADLTMGEALRVMIKDVGDPPARAFARATSIPASLLRDGDGAGHWPKDIKDLIHLSSDFHPRPAVSLF